MITGWLNWFNRFLAELPTDILLLEPHQIPFVASPWTLDLPYLAYNEHRDTGVGPVRAFGETETARNPAARNQYRAFCRANVELALARVHQALVVQNEDEEPWYRRLRSSIRTTSDVYKIIDGLPRLALGTRKDRYDSIIGEFFQRARAYNPAPLITRLRTSAAHPSRLAYVHRTRRNPSLPNLHFTHANQEFLVDGVKVTLEQGITHVRGMLRRLHKRIGEQEGSDEEIESVIIGNYTSDTMRTVLHAITSRAREAPYPVRASEGSNSASAMAAILRRWGQRDLKGEELYMATSALLEKDELEALGRASARQTARGHTPFRTAPPWKMFTRRPYIRSLAEAALQRWRKAYEADPTISAPTSADDIFSTIERCLARQRDTCNLCGGGLCLHRRARRSKPSAVEQVEQGVAVIVAEGEEAERAVAEHMQTGAGEQGISGRDEVEMEGGSRRDEVGTGDDDGASSASSDNDAADDSVMLDGAVGGTAEDPANRVAYPGDCTIGTVLNTKYQEERWALEPHNASPDRIVPGRDYGSENCHVLGVACNIIKAEYTLPVARRLVSHFGLSWRRQDRSALFVPSINSAGRTIRVPLPPVQTPPIDAHEHGMMLKLSETRWTSLRQGAAKRGLEFAITVMDLYQLLKSRRVGPGLFMCEDGCVVPMPMASFDRIDNRRGYFPDNLRGIQWAWNRLRGNKNHDEGWASQWERQNVEVVERMGQEALALGTKLPYEDWLGGEVDWAALEAEDEGGEDSGDEGDEFGAEGEDEDDQEADAFSPTSTEGHPSSLALQQGDIRLEPSLIPALLRPPPAALMRQTPRRRREMTSRWVGSGIGAAPGDDLVTRMEVGGDGACQFRAVALLARGDWTHESLRAGTVAALRDPASGWRELIEPGLDPIADGSYNEWVDRMALPATHGDLRTLCVIRRLVGIPIICVNDAAGIRGSLWADQNDLLEYEGDPIIGLWHFPEMHNAAGEIVRWGHYEVMLR